MSGSDPIIVLSMPRRDSSASYGALLGLQHCVSRPTRVMTTELPPCSLLNHSFNQHWAAALDCRDNHGATHFAMLHADISPEPGWLTVLYDKLCDHQADVISAVVPLKDERGLTSTAVYNGADPWKRRRLSLTEVAALPETFAAADAGGALLVNSGCWICDLRKPWCDDWHFHSLERIGRRSDGSRIAEVVSEDWALSHWLNQRGAVLYATSKVQLTHEGNGAFPNGAAWGAWEKDEVAA